MTSRPFVAMLAVVGVLGTVSHAQVTQSNADPTALQGVPPLIPYSGQILQPNGEPRTGNVLITFGLYADQTGGTALWTEQHVAGLDAQGRYSAVLGTVNPDGLPATVFADGKARWLAIKVEAEAELPRIMLVSVPYAMKAADADTLSGQPVASFLRVDPASSCAPPCDGKAAKAAGGGGVVGALQTISDDLIVTGNLTVNQAYKGSPNPTISGGTTIISPTAGGASQGVQLNTSGLPNGSNAIFVNAPNGWTGNYFKANLNSVESFRVGHDGTAGYLGNVGVGTTTPSSRFHVVGGTTLLAPSAAGPSQGLQISLSGLPNGSNAFFADAPLGWTGRIFKSNLNGVEKWAISQDGSVWFTGNLGIGTATPSKLLHVAGDAQVDGNIAAKYQDVAEWVDADAPLEAGTVVVIDPAASNRVATSERAYDMRVAGAVSAKPGLILGEQTPDKVLIAQSGRVRIKVDADYGAIDPGDILVTSPTPGHAMRSQPIELGGVALHRPGTVLGKALEPLAHGRGTILVLLTLQ